MALDKSRGKDGVSCGSKGRTGRHDAARPLNRQNLLASRGRRLEDSESARFDDEDTLAKIDRDLDQIGCTSPDATRTD